MQMKKRKSNKIARYRRKSAFFSMIEVTRSRLKVYNASFATQKRLAVHSSQKY